MNNEDRMIQDAFDAKNADIAELRKDLAHQTDMACQADVACTQLKAELAQCHGYASRLFKSLAPQCEPLDTVTGVISQLDNYICGLRADLAGEKAKAERLKTAAMKALSFIVYHSDARDNGTSMAFEDEVLTELQAALFGVNANSADHTQSSTGEK